MVYLCLKQRLAFWIFVLFLGRLEKRVGSNAFVPRSNSLVGLWKQKDHTIHCARLLFPRAALGSTLNGSNETDDDDTDNPSSPGRLRRKRDRIKEWVYSGKGGNKSPMVRPIREDGSTEETKKRERRSASRIKSNFDELFSGMPSMEDILSDSSDAEQDDPKIDGSSKSRGISIQNDSWFQEEKKEIEANYQEIYQEMVEQIQEQRREDPDGVPSNAEAMIQDVLKQELKTEIDATREIRAKENLDNYSTQQKEEVESRDIKGVSDPVVDKLVKEDQIAQEIADKSQARVDDYRRYELEAFLKNQNTDGAGLQVPDATADLDQWALERLQAMVDSRQDGGDDDFIVTDIIEDSLEDLRDRIEEEVGRSNRIQPETLKEWQMYRAIATRLGMQNVATDVQLGDDVAEEQIAAQLQSWKNYVEKEGIIREKSGLARGPKLPFEWQESGRDKAIEEAEMKAALESRGPMSKVEIRKEVNRKSIEALESLVETSDPIRAERLRKDIAGLKQDLEANDYLDIDEALLEDEETMDKLGPVDISDIFSSTTEAPTAAPMPSWSTGNDGNTPFYEDMGNVEGTPPPPPNSPFFSEDTGIDTLSVVTPPPATPFFAQDDETVEGPTDTPFFSSQDDSDDATDSEYSLGTIEEQKIRAMYRKAGARTEEEKAVIRAQWEEFQQFEQSRRDESGLTDGDDSELLNKADIDYDISDITTEDGDFDAAKILASIGPRPTRKRKADGIAPAPTEIGDLDDDESMSPISGLDPNEVSDSLYRAVSAVGGGRTKDDPEAKEQEKAAYSDFLEKENEMRQSLDNLNENIASELDGVEGEFDDTAYAEDVLSSLGPRPKPKRRKISAAEYSDNSIALSASDDDSDDEDEVEGTDYSGEARSDRASPNDRTSSESSEDDLVPGWLRKERESVRGQENFSGRRGGFLGSDIDDMFDDDAYEHNQRQLAEYERRRAGGRAQMGIDISDVLGRTSDDYVDYTYDDNYFRAKKGGWGAGGFESRKANLLDYTELNVVEINSLMDHKDSVHATGMSQYLPRINKPFREFGAIFRLEGVLVDTTGLQYQAWTRVAKENGLRMPTVEEVRRASVLRSDIAVREAFFWTDDFMLGREIAAAHQKALGHVFVEWMNESSISPPVEQPESHGGSLAIGEDAPASQQVAVDPVLDLDEGEKLKLFADAWSRTAAAHRLPSPSREQVGMAALVSPDIAVRNAFHWPGDQAEIAVYVSTYRAVLQDLLSNPSGEGQRMERSAMQANPAIMPKPQEPKRILDQNEMMEIHFKAWSKIAEENAFEMPLPDEVLAAFVINDPEIAIRDGFGWTDESPLLQSLVASFKESVIVFVDEFNGEASVPEPSATTLGAAAKGQQATIESNDGNWPTQEELLEMQQHAWKSAALNHGFQAPPPDQLQIAMKMSPGEAVTRLFGWTSDEAVIKAVRTTFESALKDISVKYIRKYSLKKDVFFFPGQQQSAPVDPKPATETEDHSQVVWDAWNAVAKNNRLSMPDEEEVLFAMSVGPEEAVISGFEWASQPADVAKIVDAYNAEVRRRLSQRRGAQALAQKQVEETTKAPPMFSVVPGAEQWLKSLLDVEMQCCIVSHMNRKQVDVLLEVAGLSQLFTADKRVTSSNNYGREIDQLLGASLRLERRPDHCVLFDSSPNSAVSAHDVEMRSVGVIGPFPRYELLAADSTAGSFDELAAMNIRRLFSERVHDQPMVDTQQTEPDRNTRTRTKYFWDDD